MFTCFSSPWLPISPSSVDVSPCSVDSKRSPPSSWGKEFFSPNLASSLFVAMLFTWGASSSSSVSPELSANPTELCVSVWSSSEFSAPRVKSGDLLKNSSGLDAVCSVTSSIFHPDICLVTRFEHKSSKQWRGMKIPHLFESSVHLFEFRSVHGLPFRNSCLLIQHLCYLNQKSTVDLTAPTKDVPQDHFLKCWLCLLREKTRLTNWSCLRCYMALNHRRLNSTKHQREYILFRLCKKASEI